MALNVDTAAHRSMLDVHTGPLPPVLAHDGHRQIVRFDLPVGHTEPEIAVRHGRLTVCAGGPAHVVAVPYELEADDVEATLSGRALEISLPRLHCPTLPSRAPLGLGL